MQPGHGVHVHVAAVAQRVGFQAGNGQGGPAMRPKAAHAVRSGVGESAARESESAQRRHLGKRAWRTPTPYLARGTSVPRAILVSGSDRTCRLLSGAGGFTLPCAPFPITTPAFPSPLWLLLWLALCGHVLLAGATGAPTPLWPEGAPGAFGMTPNDSPTLTRLVCSIRRARVENALLFASALRRPGFRSTCISTKRAAWPRF